MAAALGMSGRTDRRAAALVGLAGAVLSGIGDVLILGRPCSGREFDGAEGMVPPHIDADRRWRSLWNGAAFAPGRVHVGTVTGLVGIGFLQWRGMRGIARAVRPGLPRRLATASAAAFAVSGCLTHVCCATVVLAYRRSAETGTDPADGLRRSPRSATTLLAVSAVGALGALAVFSGSVTIAALRCRDGAATLWVVVTPFPCVLSSLLTFGVLPAPVAGFLRPASMSIGLVVYFAVTAALGESELGAR
jgi:hypothetical protein